MSAQEVLQRLGLRVHTLRTRAGLTQEGLAERAGISWHFISAIERGMKTPTLETLLALSSALDVSMSELFLDVDVALPKEFSRLQTALSARDSRAQRVILKIVENALSLNEAPSDAEWATRAAERRPAKPRR